MNELDRSSCPGVIALSDRDYAKFVGFPEMKGKVVYTDENDLELTILHSPALDEVLEAFGSKSKIKKLQEEHNKEIVELLCESASVVGTLRLMSHKEGWSLRFDEMTYQFSRGNSFQLEERTTVQHLLGRNEMWGKLDEDALTKDVGKRKLLSEQYKELCNGHDCVHVLGRALRKALGNEDGFTSQKGVDRLEAVLRLAYKFRHFRLSKMYKAMRSWEKSTGNRVLISTDEGIA